ncbi:MAG: universal stress protein [Corynebacterium sp.]|nr:universal stress protein [Corynebacterium sp.]
MKTIVVGTDGSKSSALAVERAATLAAALGSKLVIGSAYYESREAAQNTLRRDSVSVIGPEHAEENLTKAVELAKSLGVSDISTMVRPGTPVHALMEIVKESDADLLVVGNRGINSLTGRLLGDVPTEVARKSRVDVMIVHSVDS